MRSALLERRHTRLPGGRPRPMPVGSRRGGRRRAETATLVALVAAGASTALLVALDGSPGWRLARVAAVAAVVAALAALNRRAGEGARGLTAVASGAVFAIAGWAIAGPHFAKAGFTVTGAAAAVAGLSGLALVGLGSSVGLNRFRLPARVVVATAGVAAVAVAAWAIGPAVAATNVPPISPGTATPADVGLTFEPVRMTTSDGVTLAGWYVPSANGAAVVLRHGAGSTKANTLDHAAALARAGYGVLAVDARGHGDSEGRAMDFGWYGDLDTRAAVDHLSTRSDVDPARIGVVGMSMGGEEAIGAAAADPRIRAVVAEGATGRSNLDRWWLSEEYGVRGAVQERLDWLTSAITDRLTAASKPTPLRVAVSEAGSARFLLITAGRVPDEAQVASRLRDVAPDRVAHWEVPGSGHTGGLAVEPAGWAARVAAFLDTAL